jgi:hypothetical protein
MGITVIMAFQKRRPGKPSPKSASKFNPGNQILSKRREMWRQNVNPSPISVLR